MKIPFLNFYTDKKKIISDASRDAIKFHIIVFFSLPVCTALFILNNSEIEGSPTNFLHVIIFLAMGFILDAYLKNKLNYNEGVCLEKGKVCRTSLLTSLLAMSFYVGLLFTLEVVSKPVPVQSLYGFTLADKFDESDLDRISKQGIYSYTNEEDDVLWSYKLRDPSKPDSSTLLYLNDEDVIVRISVIISLLNNDASKSNEKMMLLNKSIVDALNDQYRSLSFLSVNNYSRPRDIDDNYEKIFKDDDISDAKYRFWGDGRNQLWMVTGSKYKNNVFTKLVLRDNRLMKDWSERKIVSLEDRKIIKDKVSQITASSWD